MPSTVLSSSSVERVRTALARAAVVTEIVELPGAARTAKAAAEFLGCEIGQIANSLVFRGISTDSAVLVMSSGAKRVDTSRLSMVVGEPVGKANADFVRKHTGFAIGGVPPIGHTGIAKKFVERGLSQYSEIWAAGGHPHTVFRLTYPQLLRITEGIAVDLAEAERN
jgi:prolyl-tRNA editing enzyme YbaK/EbsC (Cys-tRNA(Pro) deacylase)